MSRFFGFLAYLGGRKLRILVPEPKSAEGLLWLYYQELGWGDVVGQVRWLLEYGRGGGGIFLPLSFIVLILPLSMFISLVNHVPKPRANVLPENGLQVSVRKGISLERRKKLDSGQ